MDGEAWARPRKGANGHGWQGGRASRRRRDARSRERLLSPDVFGSARVEAALRSIEGVGPEGLRSRMKAGPVCRYGSAGRSRWRKRVAADRQASGLKALPHSGGRIFGPDGFPGRRRLSVPMLSTQCQCLSASVLSRPQGGFMPRCFRRSGRAFRSDAFVPSRCAISPSPGLFSGPCARRPRHRPVALPDTFDAQWEGLQARRFCSKSLRTLPELRTFPQAASRVRARRPRHRPVALRRGAAPARRRAAWRRWS